MVKSASLAINCEASESDLNSECAFESIFLYFFLPKMTACHKPDLFKIGGRIDSRSWRPAGQSVIYLKIAAPDAIR